MSSRAYVSSVMVVLIALASGCEASPSMGHSDAGGTPMACGSTLETFRIEAAVPSPDGEGWCCQPGAPTCDCGYFGGFVRERCQCGDRAGGPGSPYGACDLAPADWVLSTDAHGCQRYTGRWPGTACCNCGPDAGPRE